MKLWSDSFADAGDMPERLAAGRLDAAGVAAFSDNLSPHLAWSDLPLGTQSLTLICHDPLAPSRGDDVNQPDREVPADLPRVDFFHWVLVDLPASVSELPEGEFSSGFTARGKIGPATHLGARQGLNDFTGWFAGDPDRAGDYFGYDGPYPPVNDALVHRYVFTLYALDLDRAGVEGAFTGAEARAAIAAHTLGQARWEGRYTLNKRLRGLA